MPPHHVAKVIEIVASSEKSFDDAIAQGIDRASKTLRDVTGAEVVNWTCAIDSGKVTNYKVTLHVAFALEDKA